MSSEEAEQETKLEKEIVIEQAELEAEAEKVQPEQSELQAKLEQMEAI